MKSKILSQIFLIAFLGIIYLSTTSEKNGYVTSGTSCGTCHGGKNTATTVALTGLPATYVPGQTYTLTLTVTNTALSKAGCNIYATAGTFAAGTGTKLMGGQITHSAPKAATSGVTAFTCSWTAPAGTALVTFNSVGNAVNGDNNESSADMWNTTSINISGAYPASVNDINTTTINCYPNPANQYIIAEGINLNAKKLTVYNVFGQQMNTSFSFDNNQCRIDCSEFANGVYFITALMDGKTIKSSFIKK